MTNEEAIARIKIHKRVHKMNEPRAIHISEALNMAIKALEEQSVLDKIRDEIEALIEWHDCPIEYDNGNDAWYCEACNQAIKIIDKYKAESEVKE